MIFKDISIVFWHMIFFTSPTDNSWRYPTKNSEGSESFICCRDKRMIEVVRRVQCFIRLGMDISDLIEFTIHKLGR